MLPLITTGMPTSNSSWSLPKVLEALLSFNYERRRLRLVFVDNCSTDGTVELLEEFAAAHEGEYESVIIKRIASNIPVARNVCIQYAEGSDYIFFLDSDVVAPPNTLVQLLHHFEMFENVGMTSFPWDHVNARARARFLYEAFAKPDGPAYAYRIGNGCNLISMDAVKVVGLFNPRLRVQEDGEYCYRLRKKGYNIVCDLSNEGIHLKRVPATARYYLRFVSNSANTYLELLKLGSPMHILKFLSSVLLVSLFTILLLTNQLLHAYLFIALILVAFLANASRRVLDDGIHVKGRYWLIVAAVFTLFTVLIVMISLVRLLSRVGNFVSHVPRES